MADRRLQIFHTVGRVKSFTRAGRLLNMTQPAVTSQVRRLEDDLNVRLFDRAHNRISLTEAGERVFGYAGEILELYARMEAAVRELTGDVSGLLLLGASTTIAEYQLPALLGVFKTRFPQVDIRLRVSNTDRVVAMVEQNDIDLGVVEGPVHNKTLAVEVFQVDELVAVVPVGHPLGELPTVTVADVIGYPFIAREEGSGTRDVILDCLRASGLSEVDLDVAMELGSPEAIKGAVEAGMGVSLLSRITLAKELQLATLVVRELTPRLTRPFSFVYQRQKFRAHSMAEFLDFARRYSAAAGQSGGGRHVATT